MNGCRTQRHKHEVNRHELERLERRKQDAEFQSEILTEINTGKNIQRSMQEFLY